MKSVITENQGKEKELCDHCGGDEKEWMGMYCQMCWEYYTAEAWHEMLRIAS